MVKKLFLTPADIPEETVCRGLVIPNSQAWLGVFSEALSQTIYAYNYEQRHDTDLTPEAAAAEAYTRYVAWLSAVCGGDEPCLTPAGSKVYRISPVTKKYEYLEGEEWVEDTEIPATPAREETEEPDRLCAAAWNAVEVLRLTWVEAMAQFDENVAAQDAMVDTVLAISGLIGALFYPPIIALAGLTQLGWEIVYHAYEALTAIDWDEEFTRVLSCLFLTHASETDSVVVFDLEGIMHDLWLLTFTGEAYLTMAAQVQWLISNIGPDGVNMAGSLDLVEGDCDTCGVWCYESDDWSLWSVLRGGLIMNSGLGPVRATAGNPGYGSPHGSHSIYAEVEMDIDTTDCIITGYQTQQIANAGATSCWHHVKADTADPAFPNTYQAANYAVPVWFGRTGGSMESTSNPFTLYAAMTDSSGSGVGRILKWRVWGTGTNPFGVGDNCT